MDFNKKILAVVTGASRGIGRALAVELSKLLGSGSTIILIARTEHALNEVKATITSCNTNVSVKVIVSDLTKPDIAEYETIFNRFEPHDYAIIFHNAGQVGITKFTTELTDIQQWRNYFDLNFFSVTVLNAVFVKCMRKFLTRILVVNISSLVGIKPFASLAMYGCAKAARTSYFQVLAVEESDVKVLNYCPGPVDTHMVDEIVENVSDEGTRKMFVELKTNKTLIEPSVTVAKLLGILREGSYKSGDIIDYYD